MRPPRTGHVLVRMNPEPSNLKHAGLAELLHCVPPSKSSSKACNTLKWHVDKSERCLHLFAANVAVSCFFLPTWLQA